MAFSTTVILKTARRDHIPGFTWKLFLKFEKLARPILGDTRVPIEGEGDCHVEFCLFLKFSGS